MRTFHICVASLVMVFALLAIFSCKSAKVTPTPIPEKKQLSRDISGIGVLSASELADFFIQNNPDIPREQIEQLAQYYIDEGQKEHINSDAAFAQMCLETGFLRFGNLVTPEMHNYAGLGAIDASRPGEYFPSEEVGVRAHIQHLHAYATTKDVPLNEPLVDNRYKYVQPRGKAKTIYQLSGTWAADEHYGEKISNLLDAMLKLHK